MPQYKQRDLSLQDQCGLAAVAVLGRSVSKVAYMMAYPSTKSNTASLGVQISRWLNDEKSKEFMNQVKSGVAQVIMSDSDNIEDLTSREGIIDALVTATRQTQGKDKISGLQSLAKLQGFDRPQDDEKPDLRRFFVAWKSDCRRCKLMELFREVQRQNQK